jgi:P-type E1-E2 ATPase
LEAGILSKDEQAQEYVCMEGADFRKAARNSDKFEQVLKKLKLIVNATAEDKLCLVHGLKGAGNTVAVTTAYSEDANSLKYSDVGFALGCEGTSTAREACDIVIQDDYFCSILEGIMYARTMLMNIQKFLQFQLTFTFVCGVIILAGICLNGEPTITAT